MARNFRGVVSIIAPARYNSSRSTSNTSSPSSSKGTTPTSTTKSSSVIKAKRTTSDKFNEILQLLWKTHLPHDPITKGLGFGESKNIVSVDDIFLNILMEGVSVSAQSDDKIVAASLNSVTTETTPTHILRYAKGVDHEQTKQLLNAYAYLMNSPQLFKRFSTNKMFEIRHICVDPSFKKDKAEETVLKQSITIGHELGYKVVRCDARSQQFAVTCRLLGLEKICDIPYHLYLNREKSAKLKVQAPEISCQVFVHVE